MTKEVPPTLQFFSALWRLLVSCSCRVFGFTPQSCDAKCLTQIVLLNACQCCVFSSYHYPLMRTGKHQERESHTGSFAPQAQLYEWYLQQCAAEYDLWLGVSWGPSADGCCHVVAAWFLWEANRVSRRGSWHLKCNQRGFFWQSE